MNPLSVEVEEELRSSFWRPNADVLKARSGESNGGNRGSISIAHQLVSSQFDPIPMLVGSTFNSFRDILLLSTCGMERSSGKRNGHLARETSKLKFSYK